MTNPARWGLVGLVVMAGPLTAQGKGPTALWLSLGLGGGYIGRHGAVALYGGYHYQRGASLFTVRSAGVAEVLAALLSGFSGGSEDTGASDIGLLYGRASHPGHGLFALSAGVGLARVTRDSSGISNRSYHLTLPLEAQVAWRPARFIGFMVLGFESLNKGRSFGGITVGVQLGRLY